MSWIAGLISGLFGGVISWLLTSFIFGPLLEGFKLKGDTVKNMHYYANVGPLRQVDDPDEMHRQILKIDEAYRTLRELGARMWSFYIMHPHHSWLFRRLNFADFEKASRSMIGIVNTSFDEKARNDRLFHGHKTSLREAFRLSKDGF